MITIDLSILNQKGTPMFYSDIFADRPPFGIAGRIFISTDTKEFYRDTGTSWELLAGPGGGTITGSGTATQVAFFNSSSSITGNNDLWWDNSNSRLGIGNNNPASNLDIHGNNATIQIDGRSTSSAFVQFVTQGVLKWRIGNLSPSNYFQIYDNANSLERVKLENTGLFTLTGKINNNETTTAVANDGWYGVYSNEDITINAGQTFTGGNSFGSLVGRNFMRYQGNATFPNAAVPASILGTNVFNFPNAGSTITITQGTGVRAFSAINAFNQLNSVNSGTITHIAGLHVLAPYRATGGVDLTCTNYYGLLINASNERTAFTITNAWGIYQEGSSDKNYLNGTTLIGTNVDTLSGAKLQVTGAATFTSNVTANSFIKVGGTSTQYLMADGSTSTLTSPITGTGAANWVARFTSSSAIGLSNIFDNNTFVGIFTSTDNLSGAKLQVNGAATISSSVTANQLIASNTAPQVDLLFSANTAFKHSIVGSNYSSSPASSNTLTFKIATGANTQIDAMILNGAGNLGLGVTPSAWNANYRALQISNRLALSGTATETLLGNNWFQNAAGSSIYLENAAAVLYRQNTGEHQWFNAPSGTAGNGINFTQAMTLNASGRLLLGTTTDNTVDLLQVAGSVKISATTTDPFTIANSTASAYNSLILSNNNNYKIAIGIGGGSVGGNLQDRGYVGTISNIDLLFNTNNTERMRINAAGGIEMKDSLKLTNFTTSGTAGSIVNYVQITVGTTNYLLPLYNLP